MEFNNLDYTVLIGYLLLMVGFGIWIANRNKAKTAKDYFLASSSLPWWAIGGSMIASNISTEQVLAMNGSGYVMGLAIGAYELTAAITLIVVAKYFLPVFLKKGIYTMPQFLEERYDSRVKTLMAFFWVALFVIVNISSVLYLGALAIESILGIHLIWGIIGLVLYSAAFSIWGGLKAVVWTDVIQVVILVVGGLVAAYYVVAFLGDGSFMGGISTMYEKAPGHFDMILDKANASYKSLPGVSVLIGGLWITHVYYWGNNQYIIQRALAAKNLKEAQKGVASAAFAKLFMPVFVVLPGIAAYVICSDPTAFGFEGALVDPSKPDSAFPWVLNNFVANGLKGLVLAALIAAIGSSVSSMVNSTSTIFTLDIYKSLMAKDKTDGHYVKMGKIFAGAALLIGAMIAPSLGSLQQVFQYIQEYTGFISPGVVAVFIFGMFWKRATANAALSAIILSLPLSWFFYQFFPDLPFLSRMAFVFLLTSTIIVVQSLYENKTASSPKRNTGMLIGIIIAFCATTIPVAVRILIGDIEVDQWMGYVMLLLSLGLFGLLMTEKKEDDPKGINIDGSLFKTDTTFLILSVAIFLTLTLIYYFLW